MVSIVVDIGVEICIDTDKRNCGSNTRKLPIDIILSNSEFNCSLTFEGGSIIYFLADGLLVLSFIFFLAFVTGQSAAAGHCTTNDFQVEGK